MSASAPHSPSRWTSEVLRPPSGLEALDRRLALIGLVLALGVWDGVATWVVWEVSGDAHRDIIHQICVQTLFWLFWLPLVPIVFVVAERLRRLEPPDWLSIALHGALATCLGCLHLVGMATLAWYGWNRASGTGTLPGNVAILLGNFFVYDFTIYTVIVVTYFGIRAVRAREAALTAEASLREAKLRAEIRGSEARLRALRAELNPHFLFNALNDVSALVRTHRGGRAVTMISRLATLLRTTLDRPSDREITLRDEVELLQKYVDLEHMRFEDRLRVNIDVEDAAIGCLLPPFSLQPLVENSIRHGFTDSPLTIDVVAVREEGRLVVAVLDDGSGFPHAVRPGVGLTNLRERLEELYGDGARLTVDNRRDGRSGAKVEIVVPARPVGQDPTPPGGGEGLPEGLPRIEDD